jgi:hypothetical protein
MSFKVAATTRLPRRPKNLLESPLRRVFLQVVDHALREGAPEVPARRCRHRLRVFHQGMTTPASSPRIEDRAHPAIPDSGYRSNDHRRASIASRVCRIDQNRATSPVGLRHQLGSHLFLTVGNPPGTRCLSQPYRSNHRQTGRLPGDQARLDLPWPSSAARMSSRRECMYPSLEAIEALPKSSFTSADPWLPGPPPRRTSGAA